MCLSSEISGQSNCYICLTWSSLFQMNSLNSVVKKVLFVFYYYWVNFDNWLQTKPYYLLVGNGFKTLPSILPCNSKSSSSLFTFGFFVWKMLFYSFRMVKYNWILSRKMQLFLQCFFTGMVQSWPLEAHLFQRATAVGTALLSSLFSAGSKKTWNSHLSLSELVAARRGMWCHRQDGDSDWNCNLSFFLGIVGFAKRTFLYQILMCGSEGIGGEPGASEILTVIFAHF